MSCRSWLGSLLAIVAVAALGCGQNNPAGGPAKPDATKQADDHHHGAGPHDGTIAEWGDGTYHVEFTVDHGKQEATVYVLGSDAKMAAPVKTEKLLLSINEPAFQVDLAAKPLDGESAGASSRFVGKHENLGIVREFAGTISGEVNGTPYAGDFKEEPH
jgi:hypothetical protein